MEDLLSSAAPASPRADAEGFLHEFLAHGSRASGEVEQAAKVRGIAKITLRRAAEVIPVKKWKASGTRGLWYWSLPDGQPQHAELSASGPESNLLTPRDSQVSKLSKLSKLSKFAPDNLLNGGDGEHLHETTPMFVNGDAARSASVMEGAQLAHPDPLGDEQVTSAQDDRHLGDPWAHAVSHRL